MSIVVCLIESVLINGLNNRLVSQQECHTRKLVGCTSRPYATGIALLNMWVPHETSKTEKAYKEKQRIRNKNCQPLRGVSFLLKETLGSHRFFEATNSK